MRPLLIESFLLVAGAPNTGKSTQLRSMFLDHRLGSGGNIPKEMNLKETYYLSPHRKLYIRLTSPHESQEDLETFIDKIKTKTLSGRWCVASAVQIEAEKNMPTLLETVKAVEARFKPERICVAILSPDHQGRIIDNGPMLFDHLWAVAGCEPFFIDARTRNSNGLLLARALLSS